jgi:quercetin dioxygenase-like cupin family protein
MRIFSLKKVLPEPVSHNKDIFKKVMIKKGIVPHLMMFSQVIFKPGQAASVHIHKDMYETFFVEEGEGIFKINGESHRLKVSDCITIYPGEVHEVKNSGKKNLILTYFGIAEE